MASAVCIIQGDGAWNFVKEKTDEYSFNIIGELEDEYA
jgi:hypothetical protein